MWINTFDIQILNIYYLSIFILRLHDSGMEASVTHINTKKTDQKSSMIQGLKQVVKVGFK